MDQGVYNPRRIFDYLEEAAEQWTAAEHQHDQLHETGKILLSKLACQHKDKGESATLAEKRARTEQEWAVHIQGELVARENAHRARARYHNMQAWAEAMRTAESTSRALTTRPMP